MKNFEQKIFSGMEIPLQKLMELNIKTIQSLSYLKPVDLLSMKRPEQTFEKHMEIFMRNSQMALNYMKDTFNILEDHWLNISKNSAENLKSMDSMDSLFSAMRKPMSQNSERSQTESRKNTQSTKSASKPAAKSASKPAAKSASKPVAKSASKPVAKSASKPVAKSASKPVAKSAPKPAAKSASKPAMERATPANMLKAQENKSMHDKPKQHEGSTHSMPKVSGLPEKSGIKDLGLLNKGNFHN